MKKTWIAALVLAGAGVGAWAMAPGAASAALLPDADTYAAMLAGLAGLTLLGRRRVRTAEPAELQTAAHAGPH